MPLVDEVMKEHGWKPSQLDAIAVSGGPGSFTGLRIGVATAKGLCHALNVPLIALDTLHLLAVQGERLDPKPQPRVAMIDARRMEVYAATFDASGECMRAAEPVEVDQRPDAFEGPAQFIGDGAVKCKKPWREKAERLWRRGPSPEMELPWQKRNSSKERMPIWAAMNPIT